MKHQTLYGCIIAIGIVTAVICVGMVTGFSVTKPFISVDPVSEKHVGDQFTLSGTTSLPVGSEILIEVYPASYESGSGTITNPETGAVTGTFSGATGTITVTKGSGNVNAWSTLIDSKTFRPGEIVVIAASLKGDIAKGDYTKGDVFTETKFTLHQISTPKSNETQFIHITPISNKHIGDKFTIVGTTNLAAGTEILVQVYPASYETGFGITTNPETGAVTGEFTGVVGTVNIASGVGGTNTWSMNIDTSTFHPAEYLVNASLFEGDVKAGDITTGKPIDVTRFTIG